MSLALICEEDSLMDCADVFVVVDDLFHGSVDIIHIDNDIIRPI